MDDLISREIEREHQNELEKVFRQFPSLRGVAQPRQQERFGRWIAVEPDEKGNTDVWLCSECKKTVRMHEKRTFCEFDYCPRCGCCMSEAIKMQAIFGTRVRCDAE